MTALGLTFAPAALAQGEPTSPPRVIFDGDLGPDPCDFANLAMAHNLHDAGEIELLGFMSTLPEASNIAVLDIMNDRHGHDIPISMFKDPSDERYNRFRRALLRVRPPALPGEQEHRLPLLGPRHAHSRADSE
jgi:hypothetical protein